MNIKLTSNEQKLVDYSKEAVVKYNKLRKLKGGIDTLYSFLMSDGGKIHDGACLESSIPQANICGERHAIANMILQESYKAKIESIVVLDPVPSTQKTSIPPCGTCRHLIWEFGTPDTTVILIQYIQREKDWIFPKTEKHLIKDLYPYPYEPKEGLWD